MLKLKALLTLVFILIIFIVFYFLNFFALIEFPVFKEVAPNPSLNNVPPLETNVDHPIEIAEVARDLYVPWSLVFTSKDRMLFTERNGNIREFVDGKLNPTPLIVFTEVSQQSEEGLMGLAVDPDYEHNKLLYTSLAYPDDSKLFVKIVKIKDNGANLEVVATILDKIPAARFHAGSRLRFGPDNMLYITTGDALVKEDAQNPNSLAGKILRINTDGSVPKDNPFLGSYIYSLGHRNPQGLDWHPLYKYLISTEHGPSGFDGPIGGDELNLIEAGKNYGWPKVSHDEILEGTKGPLKQFTPAIAPASGVFYKFSLLPQFKNKFLFGGLYGEGLYIAEFNSDGSLIDTKKISEVDYGRIRDVAVSPDGEVYFSTSNRDGRGIVRDGDDKIYKISVKNTDNIIANFGIYTYTTKRVFTLPKYHNRSSFAFIPAEDTTQVIVKNKNTTWRDFFYTLPLRIDESCLTTGTRETFCSDEVNKIRFFINDWEEKDALNKAIVAGDTLNVFYGPLNFRKP